MACKTVGICAGFVYARARSGASLQAVIQTCRDTVLAPDPSCRQQPRARRLFRSLAAFARRLGHPALRRGARAGRRFRGLRRPGGLAGRQHHSELSRRRRQPLAAGASRSILPGMCDVITPAARRDSRPRLAPREQRLVEVRHPRLTPPDAYLAELVQDRRRRRRDPLSPTGMRRTSRPGSSDRSSSGASARRNSVTGMRWTLATSSRVRPQRPRTAGPDDDGCDHVAGAGGVIVERSQYVAGAERKPHLLVHLAQRGLLGRLAGSMRPPGSAHCPPWLDNAAARRVEQHRGAPAPCGGRRDSGAARPLGLPRPRPVRPRQRVGCPRPVDAPGRPRADRAPLRAGSRPVACAILAGPRPAT